MSHSILLSTIHEGSRARNAKKYGNLDGLVDSLTRLGSLHPLVLSRRLDNTGYDLIAGGRRFKALQKMGVTELYHGSVLRPGRYGFLFEDEVPKHTRLEAELDENLYRLDMDWIDSVLLIDDTHQAKKAINNKWGYEQTAAMLGDGYGKSTVGNAVLVAKYLRKGDKDMLACESMSAALCLMLKRADDAALAELQRRALPTPDTATPSGYSFLDQINISLGPKIEFPKGGEPIAASTVSTNTTTEATATAAVTVQSTTAAPVDIPLSRMFVLGDSLLGDSPVMASLPDATFHHIVTDIPYGIDMDNLSVSNKESVSAEHEVEANIDLMPKFLSEAYRLVRPGGFCVFFYDLDHHEKLQTWARAAGWKVQRWPFIAVKTSSCSNQAAQYNLTKNYEVAMFLRHDESSVLRHDPKFALNNSSWKAYDFASERKLYSNPFAKPFELWKDIFDMVAFPGQNFYDPFAGECSSLRAAANCGITPFGSEVSPIHYNRGVENLKAVYARIHTSNVTFS